MHTSREQTQHPGSVRRIRGLPENRLIDHDNRVRPQHHVLGPSAPDRQGLFLRQSLRALARRLARPRRLIDIRRLHGKRNTRVAQKILTARRSGGENEHGILILPIHWPLHYLMPTSPRTDSISFAESYPVPSLKTVSTFSMSSIFFDGSPLMTTKSACLPGAIVPIRSS